ncbi:suppressor of tub2 mutation [Coemansia guatemalensis]|uniref:Suppressor of tub2 mutation n=1 Tax=Coemansia guatemalensis TaxID=2761395 RepID=A0A9W8LQE6_9FUNG|nr:suppressor of tub2 mutation [Coemansia guatemalensis]
MTETLDQVWRALQGIQALSIEGKVAALDRLREGLAQGANGSSKATEGIITALAPMLGSSQVIACQAALACVQPLTEYATREASTQIVKALLHFILPQVLDRLGDGKMALRELALSTLVAMWAEMSALQSKTPLASGREWPRQPDEPLNGTVPSSIPRLASPFRPGIAKARAPGQPTSPQSSQWNAVAVFERDVQAQGFGHKTWRVREMALEWLIACIEQYPAFPAARYVSHAFALLDDNQDAVRLASKRALNTMYHTRAELQEQIVARAQRLAPQRTTVLSAITAPPGELSAALSPSFGGMRSTSRMGASQIARPHSRVSSSRADSRAGIFQGSQFGSRPPVPALPGGGPRSMSQQGHRPGSRAGFSNPLYPSPHHSARGAQRWQQLPSSPGAHVQLGGLVAGVGGQSSPSSPHSSAPASMLPRPMSSMGGRRTAPGVGPRRPIRRQTSSAQIAVPFAPSQNTPATVCVHHVPSKASLTSEFSRTAGFFAGRESEDNWVQRERAVKLYRGIVWGNAATEFRAELVELLKEYVHQVMQAVGSLRTSLSAHAMDLCDDISARLGPHADVVADAIIEALLKQCAQTKKIGAQRAALSLTTAMQGFPLRARRVELLRLRMSEKSAGLRLAVVSACIGILQSHGVHLDSGDRRSADILSHLADIAACGLSDALPSVRELARDLFWALYDVSETQANRVMAELPSGVRASLGRARPVRDSRQQSPAPSRASGARSSFGSVQGGSTLSLMSMVAGPSPQRSPSAGPSGLSLANGSDSLIEESRTVQPAYGLHSGQSPIAAGSLAEADEAEETKESIVSDAPARADADASNSPRTPTARSSNHRPHLRVAELSTPARARVSLGLIDFSMVEMGESLLDIANTDSPSRSTVTQESCAAPAQPITTESPAEGRDTGFGSGGAHGQPSMLGQPAESAAQSPPPTPDRMPHISPSPSSATRNTSTASLSPGALATPRTQGARYWHGPLEPAVPPTTLRHPVAASPMAAGTPQRQSQAESYLQRLAANDDVDERLFRNLARFAKEESGAVWMDEEHGGRAYLVRVLEACLTWLRTPAEGRDAVFTRDSCFDVLRVLVRRKSQHFSLPSARLLLLEILRSRLFESTILSGSAEDVFYDMATHLDAGLCLALAEDFFCRAPLPPIQEPGAARPGYAAPLETQIPTPAELDPLGIIPMENALAGVLEFVAEVVARLPSPDSIGAEELSRIMPHLMASLAHPRSQVRRAALTPIAAVYEKLGTSDSEFEHLLLRASSEELTASLNPLAKYILQLQRPELRRLIWSFCQSRRDA